MASDSVPTGQNPDVAARLWGGSGHKWILHYKIYRMLKLEGTPVGFDGAITILTQDGWEAGDIKSHEHKKWIWLSKLVRIDIFKIGKADMPWKTYQEMLLVQDRNHLLWYLYPEDFIKRCLHGPAQNANQYPFGHQDYLIVHSILLL